MTSLKYVCENDKATNVLIFIHGFLGGENTFVNSDGLHIYDLLPENLKESCACANFIYTARLFDKRLMRSVLAKVSFNRIKYKCNRTIPECAELLLTHCINLSSKYENVCLIGHSMGGLVGSWVTLNLSIMNKFENISMVTFATPHRGAELATIGKLVRRNNYINDLSPLSDVIKQLEDDWSEKNPRVKCKFFAGHDDDIVPVESCVPRYISDTPVRVDGCHETLVKPTDSYNMVISSFSKVLKEFLVIHDKSPKNKGKKKKNPLFQAFSYSNESFYYNREVDNTFTSILDGSNVWVYGDKGVGKTTLIQRNIIKKECILYYIDLSSYKDITTESLLEEIYSEVLYRITGEFADLRRGLPQQDIVKNICHNLLLLGEDEMHCIVVDEYHDNCPEMLDEIIGTATAIANTYKNSNFKSAGNVRFVFSSLIFRKQKNSIIASRFSENFCVLHMPKWQDNDLEMLLELINDNLDIELNNDQISEIILYSSGTPRELKRILKSIYFQLDNISKFSIVEAAMELKAQ